ncbi:MAG: dihydroorotate dehydrogenase electron transfer subunit [Lachnospiraceae bacterium]|nr:dihydroorotate dehydrogenase electron transfer subunit [Candidatus Equihabitans merdae]
MKKKEVAKVISQKQLMTDIYDLTLAVSFAGDCRPGQFVSLYMNDAGHLMPRPISICGIGEDYIRMVYRVAGEGTKVFSALKAGDEITVMGPLGNGFPLDVCDGKDVVLVGGGIGIPPMVGCGAALVKAGNAKSVTFAVGYRSERYLDEDMAAIAPLIYSTEDGSAGTKGNVVDAMKAADLKADVMFACGPKPMLRALKAYCDAQGMELWVSMEEKMACGIGACLGCICQSTEVDHHSHVHNKRVCTDGPVFKAEEIEL